MAGLLVSPPPFTFSADRLTLTLASEFIAHISTLSPLLFPLALTVDLLSHRPSSHVRQFPPGESGRNGYRREYERCPQHERPR